MNMTDSFEPKGDAALSDEFMSVDAFLEAPAEAVRFAHVESQPA